MKLPQVTLRELFWLVLIVALALGWWVDRSRPVQPPAPPAGRYQMFLDKGDELYMVDTATGKYSIYSRSDFKWYERKSPWEPR